MAQGNKCKAAKLQQKYARLVLKRLKDTALYVDPENPTKPMNGVQLKAGELFLRKTMPDLKSTEVKGRVDSKIKVTITKI